jgi:hypothetical protein
LPDRFAERYDELDRRLTQLLEYVRQVETRAAAVDRILDDPLAQIAEGALMLEQAEATCARAFGTKVPEDIVAKPRLAREKLAAARAAIAAGAERPLDAVRLAQEVGTLARGVEKLAATQ